MTATHPEDWFGKLQVLLDFLVAVTKQQRLCHVVLSTADSGLTFWLQHRKWCYCISDIALCCVLVVM